MRTLLACALWLLCLPASALEVIETPQINGIDEAVLERRGAEAYAQRIAQARAKGELGCRDYCVEIGNAIRRVLAAARTQGARADRIHWRFQIVHGPSAEAFAMPGGQVFLSEGLVRELSMNEAEVAFVLAHEVAHVLLQHERQTLAAADALMQFHGVTHSVEDIYFQMGFDFGLLLKLEPLMKETEIEADEAGLMLGALAGYRPERMLGFMRKLAAQEKQAHPVLATHPDGPARLVALRQKLPLAQRIWQRFYAQP